MRTLAPKQNQLQKQASFSHAQPQPLAPGPRDRAGLILYWQRTLGNQAVQQLLQTQAEASEVRLTTLASPPLQTKLQVDEPGDLYEQEADRVAAQVTAKPQKTAVSGAPSDIQRLAGQPSGQAESAPASVDQALASPGWPLEPALRQDMEQRFGYDFSGIRVHAGGADEQSAQDVNANAYTVGYNIIFGAGQFAPGTHQGRRLLAHELSHVVQQGGGSRKTSEAPSTLSAGPRGYAQRQPKQLPKYSQSTEEQIATLMHEHPGLSRANAERAIQGPPGSVPTASGIPGATGTKGGELPKVPDIEFRLPTVRGSSGLFRREVKVFQGGAQSSFNKTVSKAADQLEAGGGGELLVQVPKGTNARSLVQGFKGAGKLPPDVQAQRLGRYRSIEITIVDPEGKVLLSESLEFPPAKILPSAGGGQGIAPVAPRAQGASGDITGKPTGVTASGGGEGGAPLAPLAQETHGEIRVPDRGPVTTGGVEVNVTGAPSVAESAIKLAVTEIALNVLLFAVAYYLNKWHADKQVRKFKSDLKGLLPAINTRLKNEEAEIVKKAKAFPLVYGNITIVYSRDACQADIDECQGDYHEGSMSIQAVTISHQNYMTPQRFLMARTFEESSYYMTFSVPLFEEKTAEKGASNLARYRRVRENLTYPGSRVRLSAVITLYKLAKQDSSLKTLVVRDLLGMLKDEDAFVREAAVVALSDLKAKIAIQYIREVIPITSDDKQKELIQRCLRELEQVETTKAPDMPAGFLPIVRVIHDSVAAIRKDLIAMRGAGAAHLEDAIKHLSFVEVATDYTAPTFNYLTGTERFLLISQAVKDTLKILESVFGANPPRRQYDLLARLWMVKYQLDALEEDWPRIIKQPSK
jgi:hypothetical protein